MKADVYTRVTDKIVADLENGVRTWVDSVIGGAVEPKRPCDPSCGVLGVPWLEPCTNTLLKVRDDLVSDTGIDISFHCLFSFWLVAVALLLQPN